MTDASLAEFLVRNVQNKEDREFLALFFDAMGVKDMDGFKQLPEEAWATLESGIMPGLANTLRGQLRPPPAMLSRASVAGTSMVSTKSSGTPTPSWGSPVRRPVVFPSFAAPTLPADSTTRSRDQEPSVSSALPARSLSPPPSSVTQNHPSPPSAAPTPSASKPSWGHQSTSALQEPANEPAVFHAKRQNRAAGIFNASMMRASLPGIEPSGPAMPTPSQPPAAAAPSLPQSAYVAPVPKPPVSHGNPSPTKSPRPIPTTSQTKTGAMSPKTTSPISASMPVESTLGTVPYRL